MLGASRLAGHAKNSEKARLIGFISFCVTRADKRARRERMSDDHPLTPKTEVAAREREILRRYWENNIRIMGALLAIWALVSLGGGILLADVLAVWELPGTGYPIGFWFAQQGSIVTFVVLILIYALAMNRLDRKHQRERAEVAPEEKGTALDGESYRGEGI